MKTLQGLLQRLFLAVEAVFNLAFGDKNNPLYHLGAIAFFLFWIVAASGLYLYAFFETGVSEAYASVQALTEAQWYAGGIMRSLHRYASDGMALTMVIHMLRHFAFNRLRGFRSFSWLTGVILIWLVYASAVNGYMLPWDKLAQFVVVATFEWLDWLPVFDGALIRNFMYQESVNDRLFSLLSFIHLGVPLLVLLLMWIHVQRVPKTSTNPPRPIMIQVTLSLLALSLVLPAQSQGGPADFGVAPVELALDWFYLVVFPLFYAWPLSQVWLLVAGATALLVLLPWLPPQFRRRGSREFAVTLAPAARQVLARPGETILEAGLRAGINLPYECRNGGCGVCKCSIVFGRVDHGVYQPRALSEEERSRGMALMCCAKPLSDLEVDYQGEGAAVATFQGRVSAMELLAPDVMRVMIALPAGERIVFRAGQYINILAPDGGRRAFSFANPPHEGGDIELHVRRIPGGRYTGHVFSAMKAGDEVRFEGPLGSFVLRDSDRPIIFVAGATGFAPIKSIVEDAFHRNIQRPMRLYWGVRKKRDLYLLSLAERWQEKHPQFTFIPVLSEAGAEDEWSGRTGLVHEAILEDFPALTGYEVYVCGSVQMVDAAFPAFLKQGLSEEFCFSDAFVAAPPKPG